MTKTKSWCGAIIADAGDLLAAIGRHDLATAAARYALSEARWLVAAAEFDGLDAVTRAAQVRTSAGWAVLAALFDAEGQPGPEMASAAMIEHAQPEVADPLSLVVAAAADFILDVASDPLGAPRRARITGCRLLPTTTNQTSDPKRGTT